VYRAGAAVQDASLPRPVRPAQPAQIIEKEEDADVEDGIRDAAESDEAGHDVIERSEVDEFYQHAEFEDVAELYTWGKAANYQLGFPALGEIQPVPRLVPVKGSLQVANLACGRFHSVAVTSCGRVFAWGFGGTTSRLGVESQDGGSSVACLVEPTELGEFRCSDTSARKASVGMNHSLVLTSSGKVFGWGSNTRGQVGAQGAPYGEDAQVRRPTLLKGALRSEHITDIAAGAEHSLCVTEAGSIFAWGCNVNGSLGLGLAPQGPSEATVPKALVQLKAAHAVVASSSAPLSAALVGHGDAVIWGAAPTQGQASDSRGHPTSSGPASSNSRGTGASQSSKTSTLPISASDPRFALPSRVRRKERKVSMDCKIASRAGDAASQSFRMRASSGEEEGEEWQFQRSTAGASLLPIRSVVLTADEAFAVDTAGFLWTWSCRAPRPCMAEPAYITTVKGESDSALVPPMRQVTVPDRLGGLWAIDDQVSRNLWRLERDGEGWSAERYNRLSQVTHFQGSGEHQAAVVKYRRPVKVLPHEESAGLDEEAREHGGSSSSTSKATIPRNTHHADVDADTDAVTGVAAPAAKLPSLQRLCEERMTRLLSPRNLGMVCEVAWDLRCPTLLDAAYLFLWANTWLMSSHHYLTVLAQMPEEVMTAFEMTLAGGFKRPSEALEADPSEWPLPEFDIVMEEGTALAEGDARESAVEGTLRQEPDRGRRRRRQQGGSKGGPAGDKAASSPSLSSKPCQKQAASPQGGSAKSPATSSWPTRGSPSSRPAAQLPAGAWETLPQSGKSPNLGPASVSKSGAAPEDWVEVKVAKRKPAGTASVAAGAAVSTPASSPAWGPSRPSGKASPEVVSMPAGSPHQGPSGQGSLPGTPGFRPAPLSLGDFMKPRPSSSAATSSPPNHPSQPVAPTVSIAPPPSQSGAASSSNPLPASTQVPHSLPQTVIATSPPLVPQKAAAQEGPSQMLSAAVKSAQASWALPDAKDEAPSFRQILEEEQGSFSGPKPTAEDANSDRTRNSWGMDVMPSMQPKRDSVYTIQQQEVDERERMKELAEIRDIEAMFAALEIAELAEEREALGLPNPDTVEATASTASAGPKGRKKHDASSKGRGKGGRKGGRRDKAENEGRQGHTSKTSSSSWEPARSGWHQWQAGDQDWWQGSRDWHRGYGRSRGQQKPNDDGQQWTAKASDG